MNERFGCKGDDMGLKSAIHRLLRALTDNEIMGPQ